jgi:two-component system, OmpR family, sensor kinase
VPTQPPGWDGAGALLSSRPVQPFHDDSRHGGGGFLPPRQPSEAELQGRLLGTPRRTSKRRLQRVNGELRDANTGEAFGEVPFDSGPYQQFKPPQQSPSPQPQQGQSPQPLPPQPQHNGSGPHHYGSGPQHQYGSGPQYYGSGPRQMPQAPPQPIPQAPQQPPHTGGAQR